LVENHLPEAKSFVHLKMNFIKNMPTLTRLQWVIWIAVFFIIFFSILPVDGFKHASIFTVISVAFYLLVIYGNIKFLYPRFYEKGHRAQYVIYVVLLLVVGGVARGFLIMYSYNTFFASHPEKMTFSMMLNFVVAGFMTYLLSFIFRIALAYFEIKQQSEKILVQKSQAELNLLKSQVQPHFLFNTLNNIYYEAYVDSPRTAKLVEQLSNIMRYFVDESPKDEVSINTEIQFLENYIALEKIRIRHEISIHFIQDCSPHLQIPPMLLMTFVENIFKHGIDKASIDNKIELALMQHGRYLTFETKNRIFNQKVADAAGGFGIQNLRKRLELLYGNKFELTINNSEEMFTAFLKIPLA
jgi:sensor histidine kinase YesM